MVKFDLPFFPPSTNKAYYTRHGRRHLSEEGKRFETEVTAYLSQHYFKECRLFKPNKPYLLYLRILTDCIENAGWPNKCATRYKIFDVTNRVKLAEDAFKKAFGIDDSQHIAFLVHKLETKPEEPPHMQLFAWSLEEEVTPLDAFARL